ncbi:hypothetical protein E2C01_045288 [Portunus trituberculatus]|uniref:Uncharacterized protein n=1 Tax=Portunus trituberculatus TaxID=210409 RepID=A0A5B7G2G2_PORTR|nr:hypothetical protein [Portunus trituberculatus]
MEGNGFYATFQKLTQISSSTTDMAWLVLTLAMVGKVTVSGAFMILLVYRLELQPTEVRLQSKGVGLLSTNVAYCVAPYITDLLVSLVRTRFGDGRLDKAYSPCGAAAPLSLTENPSGRSLPVAHG